MKTPTSSDASPLTHCSALIAGDRFFCCNGVLWTVLEQRGEELTARKHSSLSIKLGKAGYGYQGDGLCTFQGCVSVVFVPVARGTAKRAHFKPNAQVEEPAVAVPPVPLARLVERLFVERLFVARSHMAPHQKERDNGKLILDCCEYLGGLALSIDHIEEQLMDGARIVKQDGKWHLFAMDGDGLKTRDSLAELIADLPPLNA